MGMGLGLMGGASGGAAAGGMLGQVLPWLNMAQSTLEMVGPNSPLVKGDPIGAAKGAASIYGAYNQINQPQYSPPQSAPIGTKPTPENPVIGSPEVLGGASADSFSGLPPDVKKQVMQILMMRKP